MVFSRLRTGAFAFVVIALIVLAAQPTARAAEGGPSTPPTKSIDAALASGRITKETLDKLHQSGTAPVVVRLLLPTPFRPEGTISSLADQQRQAIASAQDRVLNLLTGQRVQKVKRFKTIPHLALEVDMRALSALIAMTDVAIIHPDRRHSPSLNASLPLVGATNVRNALGTASTGAGQTVAILDTGVATDHLFLGGRVVSEACYTTDSGTLDATCPNGDEESTASGSAAPCSFARCDHGTHVAGIAAGDGTGVPGAPAAGVAPAANLIAINVASRENNATNCPPLVPAPCSTALSSDVIRGLERVYDLRTTRSIAAVNFSFGGGNWTNQTTCDDNNSDLKDMIDNLRSRNIPVVVASGNNASPGGAFTVGIAGPACISSAISVGRTQGAGATESVFPTSQAAAFLDLLAPGTNITSSTGAPSNFNPPKSGTSMAAPHVSGAFAVLRSLRSGQPLDTYLNAITATGVPITDTRGGLNIVTPRLQLDAAAESLIGRPLQPTNLNTTLALGRSIGLAWTDNAFGEGYYKVEYRKAGDFGWLRSDDAPVNAQGATVGGLRNQTAYEFQVSACYPNGQCSTPSNRASRSTLNTIPSAPNLQAGALTPNSFQLTWSPSSSVQVVGYQLRHDAPWGNGQYQTSTPGGASTGTPVGVFAQGATYHVYLAACGVDGDCSRETYLPVTTPLPPGTPSGLRVDNRTTTTVNGVSGDNFMLSWLSNAADMVAFDVEWYRGFSGVIVPNPQTHRTRIQSADLCCWFDPYGPASPPPPGTRVHYTHRLTPPGSTGGFVVFRVRGVTSSGSVTSWSPDFTYPYP